MSQAKCTSQTHVDPDDHCTCTCAPTAVLPFVQGKELLSPGKNAMYNEEHKIVTPMNVGPFTLYPYVLRILLLLW